MFDDGGHDDGLAGDNVYGVSVYVGTGNFQHFIYNKIKSLVVWQ